MNRRFFRVLLGVALVVWGLAAWQLWQAWRVGPSAETRAAMNAGTAAEDTCRRDPFALNARTQAAPKSPVPQRAAAPTDGKSVTPALLPTLPEWGGFMDGSPAMVLLRSGGKTEIVKPGDSLLGWKIIAVSAHGAKLRCGAATAVVAP